VIGSEEYSYQITHF